MEDTRTEPSMDDILASIKRIIADDAPADGTPLTGEAVRDSDGGNDDDGTMPALLDDAPPAASVASTPAPAFVATPFAPEAVAPPPVPAAPIPAPAPVVPTPAAAPATPPAGATLVSENAASASRMSLAVLSSMMVRPASGGVTLDGLVGELLRPMLTEWLDAHLPAVVEKLVAREIARISAQQG